jgi:hypothetical protein
MATVLLFIDNEEPFLIIDKKFRFTRVPSVGEFVALGNDEDSIAADYEVVLVHHLPLRPEGVDAEVYMRRIYMPHQIHQRAPKDHPSDAPWKPGSRPQCAVGKAERAARQRGQRAGKRAG